MPHTEVLLFREEDDVPLLTWFESIPPRARDDCLERLRLLEQLGHELRRPHAEYLRDGIHELRAKREGINYPMFYFFHGRKAVVVSHGIVKQQATMPAREINRAVERMSRFRSEPTKHTFSPRRYAMARRHRFESPALQHLYDRYVGEDPQRHAEYEESVANAKVAMLIYQLRTKAKLTQAELAKKVGTSRSVISRLEDADYEGHSVALLRRVAEAMGKRVEIRFVPKRSPKTTAVCKPAKRKRVA